MASWVALGEVCSVDLRKVPFSLLCSGKTTPGIEFQAPQLKRDRDLVETVQWRAMRMIVGLERISYEEKLIDRGLFRLDKRRLRWALINIHKYLRGGSRWW